MLGRLRGRAQQLAAAFGAQFPTTQGLPEDLHAAATSLRALECELPDHQLKLIARFRRLVRFPPPHPAPLAPRRCAARAHAAAHRLPSRPRPRPLSHASHAGA